MTEEEKEILMVRKRQVSEQLASLDIDRYGLATVDGRLYQYVCTVARDPAGHNLWEQLAVVHFLEMCDRYGLDSLRVRRFYAFYEFLYFPGKVGSVRYSLTPVQCFQFASVYGFWRDGRRVVRECALYVPRKFSKTTGSAAFALWDLLFGDANAESYIGANSQDQAKKCFDVIRGCVLKLDPEGTRYVVNKEVIKPTRRNSRPAFAQCLTANARTKDGLNASVIIMDEYSQARDATLFQVLTTSMGVRDNPLTVIITTASDVFDGPFYGMLEGYKQVLLGNCPDDTLFAHLFEPDIGDREDDPVTWRKVHPHLGITVHPEFYESEWRRAQREGAEAKLAFRTKLLNIYCVDDRKSWIPAKLAREMSRKIELTDIKGRPAATVSMDLSVRGDFSAVTWGIYIRDIKSFFYYTAYFFPEGALTDHPNERLYRGWAAQGHLRLTPGDVIDYRCIVEYILGLQPYLNIVAIGYDSYKAKEPVNMLHASGAGHVLRAVPQTLGAFTSACESFEVGARTGHIIINSNPINHYCFGNAVLMTDSLDNCKPEKRQDTQRIDGVITMLMCHKLFAELYRTAE